jgi:mutator protein MutT
MEQHVVVAAVLHFEEKILLCHRSPTRTWFPNVWDFAGGHVESGESPAAALSRELFEELGVTPLQLGATAIISTVTDELNLTVWECTAWTGAIENRQPDEHDEIAWFTRAELDALTLADSSYRAILRRLLEP